MTDPFANIPHDPFLESAGDGVPAFKFENLGDTISGVVKKIEQRQDTTIDGVPKTWDNGTPMSMFVFTLETPGGQRNIYVRGNMVKAIREAANNESTIGKRLTVQHHALGDKKPGKFPAKLFRAKVESVQPALSKSQHWDTPLTATDQAKMAAAGFVPQQIDPNSVPF